MSVNMNNFKRNSEIPFLDHSAPDCEKFVVSD